MAYGAYGLRKDGSFNKSYIYLDGSGTAVLYNETGEEVERGTYSAFPERGENAYRFTGSESNFIFNTYIFDGDYAYTVYTAENDGVYVNGDWSRAELNCCAKTRRHKSRNFVFYARRKKL